MTITRLYALWCDHCHYAGPQGENKADVLRSARKLGWHITRPSARHPHTTRALCSYCHRVGL